MIVNHVNQIDVPARQMVFRDQTFGKQKQGSFIENRQMVQVRAEAYPEELVEPSPSQRLATAEQKISTPRALTEQIKTELVSSDYLSKSQAVKDARELAEKAQNAFIPESPRRQFIGSIHSGKGTPMKYQGVTTEEDDDDMDSYRNQE